MSTSQSYDANVDGVEIPIAMTGAASLSSAIASLKSYDAPEPGEETTTQAALEEDVPPEGSQLVIQTLYEGPAKCHCCKNWVEEYPDDLRMAVEDQPETKRKAFVVRMGKNHDGEKPLVLDSIVVQSPSLKKTLGEVFSGFAGITASLKKLVFKAPFHPFYNRWKLFSEILERQKREDPDAAAYTQLLYDVLNSELKDDMDEIEDHVSHGVITYRLLWALFEPGSRIVTAPMLDERFLIVESTQYDSNEGYFGVHAKGIDWDGKEFGYANAMLPIFQFSGTRRINELLVFPESFHSSIDKARLNAISRGRIFQKLHGIHYRAYSGAMLLKNGNTNAERNVDGRIIIDAASYLDANPDENRGLVALDDNSMMPTLHISDDGHADVYDNFDDFNTRRPDKSGKQIRELTDEQLLLCSPHVRGYSLKLKKWGMFEVTKITSIIWNNDAFSHLMLPTGYKNLILSFVEGQATSKKAFDDVIKGKGLGILMLLVGSPGTGKTLTGEAVADRVQKPLYMLSAGELGQSAEDIENRLTDILQLTEKWNAVLLFDECDVFLQERSIQHLAHNEIVAVFLRLLEYYRGILIMTSNRADIIDRAFKSRIHLILHYPELVPQAKEQIWRQFVHRSNSQNILTDDEYSRLGALPMNGRQIKNVVQIATLLAGQERTVLGIDQIRIVLQATKEVDNEGI
ncbi:P-loop containing nucleoside triphosphate hydrolase protein [Aspergillus caelatus]|uniref:P-loop containing nucleoside triphosphate hydrolase protein n=1 Tax=Aspergillus caelatus TaxID=61420 RepID=A0A5N7AL75_9EURO|nr:P-loop containing nucleoside triphosphate hydrolase protein [Aspergillus caelatus]KAE8370617.1 P-loop containing nucleoside triphosphate hydrolase protein [Aspergillus caelatus]